jgi:ankyrin repeat protein
LAAVNGHEAVAKLLLDKDADVESKDFFSRTPLSWAAEYRHEAVVKLLLDKNANLESEDDNGLTPLSWAVENHREAVVKLLLDKNDHQRARHDQIQEAPWDPTCIYISFCFQTIFP